MSDQKKIALDLIEKATEQLVSAFNFHINRLRTEGLSEDKMRYSGGFSSAIDQFVSLLALGRSQIEKDEEINFKSAQNKEDVEGSVTVSAAV